MGIEFEKAKSMKELDKDIRQCKRGSSQKDTPVDWYLHSLTRSKALKDDVTNGNYHMRPGRKVQIYRPKRREAIAPWFRDRVWQRAMCNCGVYQDLTKSNIYDNIACQKGKGVDLAIRRIVRKLQKLYSHSGGAQIYGIHLDIRKFFPSTPQSEVLRLDQRKVREECFLPYLQELIQSVQDQRSEKEISEDPFGARGTGLGSQINQLNQVALLDRIDHEIIHLGVEYMRYNDDFLILSTEKQKLNAAKRVIVSMTSELGLEVTDKTGLFNVKQGFTFIGKRFILTDTGKIHIRLRREAMKDERQTLRILKHDLDMGLTDEGHIKRHYQSWVANAEYAGDAPIRAMDKFYTELFRKKPEYKRKRRYLYGKNNYQKRNDSSLRTTAGE